MKEKRGNVRLLNKGVRHKDGTMKKSKLSCAVEAEVKYETIPPPLEVVGSGTRLSMAGHSAEKRGGRSGDGRELKSQKKNIHTLSNTPHI